MKIGVYGLWHLGTVTSACLAAKGFDVVGIDDDAAVISNLNQGMAPIFEPGLEALLKAGLGSTLSFTSDLSKISEARIVWVAFDTPVDDNDRADTPYVIGRIEALLPHLAADTVVLISSQLPVGSTAALQKKCDADFSGKNIRMAYSPENLRLGKAIEVFQHPGRIIIGVKDEAAKTLLLPLMEPLCDQLIWTGVASAEMLKHALNAFLATSVTFINEIATICELVDADASQVEQGLRSEPRVGQKAYVKPGGAFAGGTLARDVRFLCDIAGNHGLRLPLLESILPSNQEHQQWIRRKIHYYYNDLSGKIIALLGLAYKPGTDTLRRSWSIELAQWLKAKGASVKAYDPNISSLPDSLQEYITLTHSAETAYRDADALIIANEHPSFRDIRPETIVHGMRRPLVVDQNRFLASTLGAHDGLTFVSVGMRHDIQ